MTMFRHRYWQIRLTTPRRVPVTECASCGRPITAGEEARRERDGDAVCDRCEAETEGNAKE